MRENFCEHKNVIKKKGPGRPPKEKTKIRVHLMLDPDLVNYIDDLAEKLDMSRSDLIEKFVLLGLDDVKLMDKVGAIDLIIALRAFKDYLYAKLFGRRPLFEAT